LPQKSLRDLKIDIFDTQKSLFDLTWKKRGNEFLGCDSITDGAEIFTRVGARFIASFGAKKLTIGGELHPLGGERQYR
jgi:hypothetical protein